MSSVSGPGGIIIPGGFGGLKLGFVSGPGFYIKSGSIIDLLAGSILDLLTIFYFTGTSCLGCS